jgi:alcohol dehydrogenase class IV
MEPFDVRPYPRIVFGVGSLSKLGGLAQGLGFRRPLLVADPGLVASGHVAEARAVLAASGIEAVAFHGFDHDPDSAMIDAGAAAAREARVDSLIGLGGGSSMDCAKGINFVLTNGGSMADYWGYGKAGAPLLPMIAVPTTAGTGSEAQSYALIADAKTHVKMACGDPKAAFRAAILDPALTVSQPRAVTAAAGYDAISHAVETWVTTRRNAFSDLFAGEAFRLLEGHYERVLREPGDVDARGAMLLGAHYAGIAIESSMLGATHACANPLTARYGTAHGVAIGLMLPHVVRWNARAASGRYGELLAAAGRGPERDPAGALADRLEALAVAGGLPRRLGAAGVAEADLPELAEQAAEQWTGRFNPRPFDGAGALELYRGAF